MEENISPTLLSKADILALHRGIRPGALNWWLFHAKRNGLESALVRIGRRVYFEKSLFNSWLMSHQDRGGQSV